jgi:hypothetical protein
MTLIGALILVNPWLGDTGSELERLALWSVRHLCVVAAAFLCILNPAKNPAGKSPHLPVLVPVGPHSCFFLCLTQEQTGTLNTHHIMKHLCLTPSVRPLLLLPVPSSPCSPTPSTAGTTVLLAQPTALTPSGDALPRHCSWLTPSLLVSLISYFLL